MLAALLPLMLSAGDFAARYSMPGAVRDTVMAVTVPPAESKGKLTVVARAAILKQSASWSLRLVRATDTVTVTFSASKASPHDVFAADMATIAVTCGSAGEKSTATCLSLSAAVNAFNTISATISGDSISLSGGHSRMQRIASFSIGHCAPVVKIETVAAGKVDLSALSLYFETDRREALSTCWTVESISGHLESPEAKLPEGIWEYLDRNTSPRKAREGGRYRLAIVRSADRPGTFDIIYLSGATVNASKWTPGMRKGRLIPTDYENHYNLEWTDATFTQRTLDMYADIEQESILTLRFPLLDSSLRFSLTSE